MISGCKPCRPITISPHAREAQQLSIRNSELLTPNSELLTQNSERPMFKIKKKAAAAKPPALYNIIEDYSEFDAPGNVTVCAMTGQENGPVHAKILSESYDIPL